MKMDLTGSRITIDAADLAPLFDLTVEVFRERMRSGRIVALSEVGEGEDAGRSRITLQDHRRKVQLIYASDGTVLQRLRLPPSGK